IRRCGHAMRGRKLAAGFGLAVVALVAAAGPAFADRLTIRKVDTTHFPEVVATVVADGTQPEPFQFNVRENGGFVHGAKVATFDQTGDLMGVVLVLDTSSAMGSQGRLDQVKAAAHWFVANRGANIRVAIVSFGDGATTVMPYSNDTDALQAAIDGLHPAG